MRPLRPLAKALATNSSDATFAAKAATKTEPSGNGVLDLCSRFEGAGGDVPCQIFLMPYGLGADNDTFSMRVISWRRIGEKGPQGTPLWVPATLVEVSCTLSASVGVAGTAVLNTERFADTITIVASMEPVSTADTTNAGLTILRFSPANDTPAWIRILDFPPCEKLEIIFDKTLNNPTMNCLYTWE